MIDLSVITATACRPDHLRRCLAQLAWQKRSGLKVEHIVVSDGPDPRARRLAQQTRARFQELPRQNGFWGACARDAGLQIARGRYVCFWDDDNIYEPHAVMSLYSVAAGVDIGVVRAWYLFRRRVGSAIIPRRWDGHFRLGDIDTMCVCVRREVALRTAWADGIPSRGNDFRWLSRLEQMGAVTRFDPVVIGIHL